MSRQPRKNPAQKKGAIVPKATDPTKGMMDTPTANARKSRQIAIQLPPFPLTSGQASARHTTPRPRSTARPPSMKPSTALVVAPGIGAVGGAYGLYSIEDKP